MLYRVNISIPFIYDVEANNPEEANEKAKEFLSIAETEAIMGGVDAVVTSVELLPEGAFNYAQE